MTEIWLHRAFRPVKKVFPRWLTEPVRRLGTALLTPLFFSYRSGHFRSSLAARAVCRKGAPIPWYTYPSIDFLKVRDFRGRSVLECGAGQSTLWWAKRAKRVVALEGSKQWYETVRKAVPPNVDLHLVSMESAEACVADVRQALESSGNAKFDVIIIDGLYREELAEMAKALVTEDGMIVCDNAESYGFRDALAESELARVDFYGYAPGVVLPHATSIYFTSKSFAFDARHDIAVMAKYE